MASMAAAIPEKLMVSSCLRPALSMRDAAITVMNTFTVPTNADARAPLLMPACQESIVSFSHHRKRICVGHLDI